MTFMSKYCTNCGNENIDDAKFCVKCGKMIETNQTESIKSKKIYNNKWVKKLLMFILAAYVILCVIAVICGISDGVKRAEEIRTEGFNNTVGTIGRNSWAEDLACKEVKSDIYSSYGEIPNLNGELIYQDGQYYVVIVKYDIPNWNWQGSCACLIYGYSEDNCFLYGMTNELSYDYDYRANLEDLKALWKLD